MLDDYSLKIPASWRIHHGKINRAEVTEVTFAQL